MAHQIHRSPAYLSRNKHGYCFRIKVPDDIKSYVGKKELRYSLKTGYLGVAKTRARFIAGNVQMLFGAIRQRGSRLKKLSPDVVNILIQQFKAQAFEIARSGNNPYDVNSPSHDPVLTGIMNDEGLSMPQRYVALNRHINILVANSRHLKFQATVGQYDDVLEAADGLCKENDVSYSKGSDAHCELCRGMLHTISDAMEAEIQKLKGNQSPAHGVETKPEVNNRKGRSDTTRVLPQQTSATIKQAGHDFWNEFNADWKPRSRTDYKNAIEQIVDGFGPDTEAKKLNITTLEVKAVVDNLNV